MDATRYSTNRRRFLTLLAAGAVAALAEAVPARTATAAATGGTPVPSAAAVTSPVAKPAVAAAPTLPAPGPAGKTTLLSMLPGQPSGPLSSQAQRIALTVDDGLSSAVVAAYIAFARSSGIRLTFFVNGANRSWTDNAAALRPLVDSGQIQVGNHTWNHPDLLTLSDKAITDQVQRNEQFLWNTYGVNARPYIRPPYGNRNKQVDLLLAQLGYRAQIFWNSSLGDYAVLSAPQIMRNAASGLKARNILLGHANQRNVTTLYPQLLAMLRERKLQTATIQDVFGSRL